MATGDPSNVTVLANGWQATVDFAALTPAGVASAYAFTPDSTPKVTFHVTSPGYDAAGNVTTIARTVIGTIYLRQPEPNDTLPTEAANGGNVRCTFVLSDYINVSDTATVDFLAGLYTSGSASTAATGLAVTNNSTVAHWTPICAWVTEGHNIIANGASLTVEAVAFHARPRSGRQVNCVKFSATDGSTTVTQLSTAMTLSQRITNGNPCPVYSATFSPAQLATLNAGVITLDFTAYPFVGDHPMTASAGQDGVAIAATVRTPNLKPIQAINDKTSAHAPIYAWVNPGVGTASGAGQVQTTATDPGLANANNYPSIYAAASAIQAYNNANRSHNDTSGGVIMCRAGTYNGFDPAAVNSMQSLNVGLGWLTVQKAPTATPAQVIYMPAISSSGDRHVQDRIKFVGITVTQADTTSNPYNLTMQGLDGANTNPIATEIVFDGCIITGVATGGWPIVFDIGLIDWYNCTTTEVHGLNNITFPFSNLRYAGRYFGTTFSWPVADSGSSNFWLYTAIGCKGVGTSLAGVGGASANYVPSTGMVNAYNSWTGATKALFFNNTSANANFPSSCIACVQNLYEKLNNDGQACCALLADSDVTVFSNFVLQYETLAGSRLNLCYNDLNPVAYQKSAVRLYTVIGTPGSWSGGGGYNIKRDTFLNPTTGLNPARVGNWQTSHGVGSVGNVFNGSVTLTIPSSQSWDGEYAGLTGSTVANNTGYDKQVSFTNDQSAFAGNAGNGTYTVTGMLASVAYGRVPSGMAGLPFDLRGVTRRNDGTGGAGAYEVVVDLSSQILAAAQVKPGAGFQTSLSSQILAATASQSAVSTSTPSFWTKETFASDVWTKQYP